MTSARSLLTSRLRAGSKSALGERWTRLPRAAALGATLAVMLLLASFSGNHNGWHLSELSVVLTVVAWAPLLVQYRWPIAVLIATVTAAGADIILLRPLDAAAIPVSSLIAIYLFALRRSPRVACPAAAAAATALLVAGLLSRRGQTATNVVVVDLVLAAAGMGVFVRSRYQQLLAMERRAQTAEHTRRQEADRQVAAERFRIARELHDVLAHSLTLVNAQAGVAGYLLRSDPDAAATALQGISQHTRQALDDLRATVGLLRQDGEDSGDTADLQPAPGLDRLDELATGFRAAGTDLTTAVTGNARALSARADLAVYRIVQEALTNASKHAPGAAVHVSLTWLADHLEVTVTNSAPVGRGAGRSGPGTGHGLIGMRERARAANGTLHAAPSPGGGFTVTATIPTATPNPSAPTAVSR